MAMTRTVLYAFLCAAGLVACAYTVPKPPPRLPWHLRAEEGPKGEIPPVLEQTPFLPPPKPTPPLEKYTVVVNEVPVKELLFALARDAAMNVDLDPGIEGIITLNAVNQTLPQILDRIARQVDLRYEIKDNNIIVSPDKPYFRTYRVDYVNMSRGTTGTVNVATQILTTGATAAGGGFVGGGGPSGTGYNNSTTVITDTSDHKFWATLTRNILALVGEEMRGGADELAITDSVIPNPESGIMNVRATSKQHAEIQAFLDQALANVQRQVLIEATIVEVRLDDRYQAGIDWSVMRLEGDVGFAGTQALTKGLPQGVMTSLILKYVNPDSDGKRISVILRLLREFGDVQVLSSPRIMALNNQMAMLKVVENVVYFDVDVNPIVVTTGIVTNPTVNTTAQTVPVGLVMTITPQISETDQITLNIRPTISSIITFVKDPNPALTTIDNLVPQIEVREMESMLKLRNGQIAVLGGLIQDKADLNTRSIPLLSKLPIVGDALFTGRTNEYTRSELVIFLRPVVVRNPSMNADFKSYRPLLQEQAPAAGSRPPYGGGGL
jgi:general secretion pathway protein D